MIQLVLSAVEDWSLYEVDSEMYQVSATNKLDTEIWSVENLNHLVLVWPCSEAIQNRRL